MSVQFSCSCGKVLAVKEENLGKRVKCPGCGNAIQTPSKPEATPAIPVEEEAPADKLSFSERVRKFICSASSWSFGTLFALAGIISLFGGPEVGLTLIVVSLLLLPPIRKIVHDKTGLSLSGRTRAIIVSILLVLFVVFAVGRQARKERQIKEQQTREAAAQQEAIKQETIEEFKANKTAMLRKWKAACDSGKYDDVISESKKYLISNDDDLRKLHDRAIKGRAEAKKEKKVQSLLAKIKATSEDHTQEIVSLYQQLTVLAPDNPGFKSQYNEYAERLVKEKEKLAELKRKEKIERILSDLKDLPEYDGNLEKITSLYKRLVTLVPDNPDYKDKYEEYSKKLAGKAERQRIVARKRKEVVKPVKVAKPKPKEIPLSDITWNEINGIYNISSRFTDLQKKAAWSRYKGKKIKWTGKVASVSETWGTLQLQVKMNPDTLTSDIMVSLKDSEKPKALRLMEGNQVTFTGIMSRWGTFLTYVSLNDGEIVE